MSLVQKMKGNDQTLSQLADSALTHILHEGVRSHRIVVVVDAHREDSLKNAERSNRGGGSTTGIQFRNMAPCHRIQQWRKLLSSSTNKANFTRSRVEDIQADGKLIDKQLYVASDETCLHITNDRWAELAGLQSNQEEADTRILLHAAHTVAECYRAVVVVTPDDIDVMVLHLAFSAGVSFPCSRNAEQRIGLGTLK